MATILGMLPVPSIGPEGWDPYFGAGQGFSQARIASPFQTSFSYLNLASSHAGNQTVPFIKTNADYIKYIMGVDAAPNVLTGDLRQRPTKVTDNLGRELTFEYYDDPSDTKRFGLLKQVNGPHNLAHTAYDYGRPAVYPEALNESFLTKVTRVDSPPSAQEWEPRTQRVIEFTYNWPGLSYQDYTAHADALKARYLAYYAGMHGCRFLTSIDTNGTPSFYTELSVCTGGSSGPSNPPPGSGPEGPEPGGPSALCHEGLAMPLAGGEPEVSWCQNVRSTRPLDNPCFLAEKAKEHYISDVADNIVRVTRYGVTEVESKYEVDPNKLDFDRVTVQRYGGMKNADYDASVKQGGRAPGAWDSSDYPEFKFEYIMTKPLGAQGEQDATETALPQALRTQYPLEALNPALELEPSASCLSAYVDGAGEDYGAICPGVRPGTEQYAPQCGASDDELLNRDHAYCDPNRQLAMQLKLPSFFRLLPWSPLQDPSPNAAHPKVYRSRMTCNQIASHHESNARQNGLVQEGVSKPAGQTGLVWNRVQDSRDEIQQDHRRICQWAKITDRDRRVQYIGLNYRGQMVVEATLVDAQTNTFTLQETLYNADGNLIEKRGVHTSQEAWNPAHGYMTRAFQEIDPHGNNGSNDWIPLWWMKRMNLVEERQYPRADQSSEAWAFDWDGQSGSTLNKRKVEWRGRQISYDPLFNQMRRVANQVKYVGQATPDEELMVIDYDYQEMDPASREFFSGVYLLQRWVWRVPEEAAMVVDSNGDPVNQAEAQAWMTDVHVPAPFYNEDLNGDGVLGFPTNDPNAPYHAKLRGFPVRVTWFERNGTSQSRVRRISPAPHGQPSQILFEDGRLTDLFYYGAEPSNVSVSTQNAGLLAKTVWHRYDGQDLPLSEGPAEAPGYAGSTGCKDLKGPFQWMLKSCGSDVHLSLENDLGLPPKIRDELLYAQGSGSPGSYQADSLYEETQYVYNTLGHVKTIKKPTDTGFRTWQVKRDVDGLVYEVNSPGGAKNTTKRALQGWPTEVTLRDSDQSVLRHTLAQYDVEGRVLTQCQDVTTGACALLLGPSGPLAFDTLRTQNNPTVLLETYRYTPEGLLLKSRDAMGTKTLYGYDDRGLMVSQAVTPQGGGTARQTGFVYNDIGLLTSSTFGTKSATYWYDGLGRQVRARDYDSAWTAFAYSGFDEHVATRLGSTLFKDSQAFQDHESRFAYDSLGRLAFGLEPNGDRTAVTYNTNHQPRRVDLYPGGTSPPRSTWMTYDRMGQLAWTMDSAGNQQVMAHHEKRQLSVEASIIAENVTPGVRGPTVSSVLTYDLQGMPLTMEQFGSKETAAPSWLEKNWQYDYNAAGDLLGQARPDTILSTATYNLVGWPLDLTDPSDVGTLMSAMTQKDYNAYGQVTKLTEPGTPAAITTYSYNGFGELTERLLPRGQRETMTYDAYGRLERHKTFKNTSQLVEDLQWTYTSSTTAHTENLKWMNSPLGQVDLASFKYDPYGRLTNTQSFGVKQASLAGQSGGPKRVDTGYVYDGAGRLITMSHGMSQGGNALWDQAVDYAYSANAGKWSMTTSVTVQGGQAGRSLGAGRCA